MSPSYADKLLDTVNGDKVGDAVDAHVYLDRVKSRYFSVDGHATFDQFVSTLNSMASGGLDIFSSIENISLLFKDAPGLVQDFDSFIPQNCHIYSPSDVDQVELIVVATPDKTRILGSLIPKGLPTTFPELRKALASGRNKQLEQLQGPSASVILQLLLMEIEQSNQILTESTYTQSCIRCLRELSIASGKLPPSLYVRNVVRDGNHTVTGSGFADIWKGQTSKGEATCMKVLRLYTEPDIRQQRKKFCTEAITWRLLRSPHVLAFSGVSVDVFDAETTLCLVSPWMQYGNIMAYLKEHPDHDRLLSIKEIAAGLRYLHEFTPSVVHGNIKGANVLVKPDLSCCLCDFGLRSLGQTQPAFSTSVALVKTSLRWMAPELLNPVAFDRKYHELQKPSDIYALGCTMLEIFTVHAPFHEQPNEAAVMLDVIRDTHPRRPSLKECDKVGLSENHWLLMEKMWSYHPKDRFDTRKVCEVLTKPSVMSQSPPPRDTLLYAPVFAKTFARRSLRC